MLLGFKIRPNLPRVVASPLFFQHHRPCLPRQIARNFSNDRSTDPKGIDSILQKFSHLRLGEGQPLADLEEKIGQFISLPELQVHPPNLKAPFDFFLTRQRFDILQQFFDKESYFLSLSGPRGVGKSVIGYAAACIAYVNRKPLFYQPTPTELVGLDLDTLWNQFVSLNEFADSAQIQSIISRHQLGDKFDLDALTSCLFLACPVRIIDEIQSAYDSPTKLHPNIDPLFFKLIHTKSSTMGGRLLAIGSANSAYNMSLHQEFITFQTTAYPPTMDELLGMMRPLAANKLSSFNPSDQQELLKEAIADLGTPRNITDFLNQLQPVSDKASFFAALKFFFDELVAQTVKLTLKAYDDLGKDAIYMESTMRQLIVSSAPPAEDDHPFCDYGLVYNARRHLEATGRFVRVAFFNFLEKRKKLFGPMADESATGSCHEDALFGTWVKRQIMKKGLVGDFSSGKERKIIVESIHTSAEKALPLTNHNTTTMVIPCQQNFGGLDFFVFDPEEKVVYAIQTSIKKFFTHQRKKANTSMDLVLTTTGETKSVGNGSAKKLICKLLGLSEDSTFTPNETTLCIDISQCGWHVIPVFITKSKLAENQLQNSDTDKMKQLGDFLKYVRLVTYEDIEEHYGWPANSTA